MIKRNKMKKQFQENNEEGSVTIEIRQNDKKEQDEETISGEQ